MNKKNCSLSEEGLRNFKDLDYNKYDTKENKQIGTELKFALDALKQVERDLAFF